MTNIAKRLTKAEAKLPPAPVERRVFRAIVDPRKPETLGGAAALEAQARAEGWDGEAFLIDRIIVDPESRP